MALPKLNNTPMYDITIPSTGKKTRFRPYLVGEEKVLMIASETKEEKQIINATLDIIESCIDDDIDVRNLPSFDAEYLFLNIRSKSVGETVDLIMLCSNCEHEQEVNVNLNEVSVDTPEKKSYIIELTKDVSLQMRYISYFDTLNSSDEEPESDVTRLYDLILSSIEAVLTEDERVIVKDETREELEEFVNGMTQKQYEKLSNFVLNMPQLKLDIKFKCDECAHENETMIMGMQNFFE